ncbi:hypothetical protein RRG08_061193 [Elysia crispata]|uniref:Cytochrome P450 n=1 Tax=Elysia crispata TaxID=231223 RepID=A0AAE1DIM5_9GAST|nr:hypothetical protein RRG08_061193 [Elysia crispata]
MPSPTSRAPSPEEPINTPHNPPQDHRARPTPHPTEIAAPARAYCTYKKGFTVWPGASNPCFAVGDTTGVMEVTWVLLAALVATLVYYAWVLLRPRHAGLNIPPFPGPKRFLTGHLHLWGSQPNLNVLHECRKKAGDIFSLDLAGKLLVVVSGYDNIKEVMVNHWNEAGNRPIHIMHKLLGEENLGIVFARSDNWKAQRATAITILRSLGMGKNVMAERIGEEVDVFVNKLASYNCKPVDIRNPLNVSVSNIICSMIVGKRFDYDDPYFVELLNNLDSFFTKRPHFIVMNFFNFLRYLPFDIFGIKAWMKYPYALRDNFSVPHINEKKKTFNTDDIPGTFITGYLQKMKQENKGSFVAKYLDEENLATTLRELFIAGSETTSTTIYWCVLICLHYPEVQEKVFQEITTHVGRDRLPNLSDKPNLKYFDAVIKETQRFAALVSAVPREVTADFELKGYTIPKGSMLMVHFASALQDAKPWGDPDKFRPERFMDADGNLIKDPQEFIPFGLGKRFCLGEALAKMELFLCLSAMFQRFRFETEDPSGKLPPMKGNFLTVFVPEAYKVKFMPRPA